MQTYNHTESNLPVGYFWDCYEDGSGRICGPNKTSYFSYDCAPYANVGWIEYQRVRLGSWDVFDGTLSEFKQYAEEQLLIMLSKGE